MILRMVDIVLIVLFGFICISTIENQKKVELPKSDRIPQEPPDDFETVTITVDALGKYYTAEKATPSNNEEVEQFLMFQKKLFGQKKGFRVKIRADRSAPMHTVKWLAELCDDLNTERSLIVIRTTNPLERGL